MKQHLTPLERFLAKIEKQENGCWIWKGELNNGGYGSTSVNSRSIMAHRWSYEYFKGAIPKDLHIDHLCRNRACVNPDHLEAVTRRENVLRGEGLPAKQAKQTYCKHGHAFDETNTIFKSDGSRACRICFNKRHVEYVRAIKVGLRTAQPRTKKEKEVKTSQSPAERFVERIEVDEHGCWNWTAGKDSNGYGQFFVDGKQVRVYRWSYEYNRGPIPKGHVIDHLCRNRACANPSHLEAVSQKENTLRGESPLAYNAAKTHCKNGHPFDESNTYYRPDRKGRVCKLCILNRQKGYWRDNPAYREYHRKLYTNRYSSDPDYRRRERERLTKLRESKKEASQGDFEEYKAACIWEKQGAYAVALI